MLQQSKHWSKNVTVQIFTEFRSYRSKNKMFLDIKNDCLKFSEYFGWLFYQDDLTFVASDFKILFLQ